MCKTVESLRRGLESPMGLAPANWRDTYKEALKIITDLRKNKDEPPKILYLPQPMPLRKKTPPIDARVFGELVKAASEESGIVVSNIMGRNRNWDMLEARYMVIIGLIFMKVSMSAIGRMMGRDHSTIIHVRGLIPTFQNDKAWVAKYRSMMERWAQIIETYQENQLK